MKPASKASVRLAAIVLGLAAILILLAILQYSWSGAVSEAASARMKANLQSSVMSFRMDLHRELAAVSAAFPSDPEDTRDRWTRYAQQYQAWNRTAAHPALIANLYVLEGAGGKQARLMRLNHSAGRFEAVAPPPSFSALSTRLAAVSADMAERFRPPDEAHHPPPNRFPNPGMRPPAGPPWVIEENLPALVRALVSHDEPRQRVEPGTMDWLVIELNSKILQDNLLPELADRYLSGPEGLEYHVAVLSGNDRSHIVYSSDSEFGGQASADATVELFGAVSFPPSARGVFVLRRPPASGGQGQTSYEARMPRFEPIHYASQDKDWLLVVKHRKGSLDAVVAGMRRRNLGISFGVLLVLAATMAMVVVASQRAHRLARLQMDFVTGVSHELRTPLTVISSAAENIADGVVGSKEQLARYASVIKKQAGQLSSLVEQVLLFAATQQNGVRYILRPLPVSDVIEAALASTTELIHGAGFTVERDIAPDLPPVMGDMGALSHCFQNLITNAVKYGGPDRWIGIRTSLEESERRRVRISIEDHGVGIEPQDLQRIFEPFYRTAAASAAQIHGSGLGLPLAKSIAEAMGGELTVASEPGKGSSFTVSLPAADESAIAAAAAASESSPQV